MARFENNQQRSADIRLTNQVSKVNNILMHRAGTDFERIYNADLQKRGIDIVIHDRKYGEMLVDEKAAIDYRLPDKKPLTTYSIELGSCNNPNRSGWFLSDHMLTTHYMFTWFRSDEDIHNVDACESAVVSKAGIKKYLEVRGLDTDTLTTLKNELSQYRADLLAGRVPSEQSSIPGVTFQMSSSNERIYCETAGGLRLTCSLNKPEMPINVLISKDDLQQMAFKNYILVGRMADVDRTHETVMAEHKPKTIPLDKIVKAIDFFNNKGFVSGQMYFGTGGQDVHQGRMPACKPGTMLFYGDKVDMIPLATFDGRKWTALIDGLKEKAPVIIGPDRKKTPVESYDDHVKACFEKGMLPYGFTQKNCLHQIVDVPSFNKTPPIRADLTDFEGLTNKTILEDRYGHQYDYNPESNKLENHIEEDADRELLDRREAELYE